MERWEVDVAHGLYSREGVWYGRLQAFPGAYFDSNGYIVFKTADEYHGCKQLQIKKNVNVPEGISKIEGYKRMDDDIDE